MNAESPSSLIEAEPVARSSGNVLIVDDEIFIRNAFQLYLETLGFTVRVAENGERALEIFSNPATRPDVVILDLVMPGLQGIDVLKALKDTDPQVEVIILTGCASMGSAIEALRSGAFDYITKPIVNFDQDLLQVIEEALRSRREKLAQASHAGAALRNGDLERLQMLDRVVEIAALGNRSQKHEGILERLEDLLRRHFGVMGGVVLQRGLSGDFLPVYSWGFSGPLSPGEEHAPDSELFAAIREGSLGFLPISSLDPGRMGILPEDLAGWRKLACLPLYLSGVHWGSLLVFFAVGDLPSDARGPTERHPFQALCPVLASMFSGALKSVRSL